MDIAFLGQPFTRADQLGRVFRELLLDTNRLHCWVVTAWVKRSGLSRVANSVKALRSRGGQAEVIVGVDEGGATWEGLGLALEIFDRVYVFHDRGPRTFHPKFYVVEGPEQAGLIMGSGNLTKGGLFTNFETAVLLGLDKSLAPDQHVLGEARSYFERLRDIGPQCKLLTPSGLESLAQDPGISIGYEGAQNRGNALRKAASPASSAFGSAITGLATAPIADVDTALLDSEDEDSVVVAGSPATQSGGFWKRLSAYDASPTSSPGQIIIPIGFADFFGSLQVQKDETATGGVRQSHALFPAIFRVSVTR